MRFHLSSQGSIPSAFSRGRNLLDGRLVGTAVGEKDVEADGVRHDSPFGATLSPIPWGGADSPWLSTFASFGRQGLQQRNINTRQRGVGPEWGTLCDVKYSLIVPNGRSEKYRQAQVSLESRVASIRVRPKKSFRRKE